jgi:hypothetical protein
VAERIVTCPACRGPSVYAPANRWRPFCSERCRQIDLGAWASEGYRVPQRSVAEDDPQDEGVVNQPTGPPTAWRH